MFDLLNIQKSLPKRNKGTSNSHKLFVAESNMWGNMCLPAEPQGLSGKLALQWKTKNCNSCTCIQHVQSIKAIVHHLLTRESNPFRYFLTYKLSQDSIELLFNKIRHRCGWNNNPIALQFKYALWRILGWNSIEPSKTGNGTPFEDSLTQVGGLVSFSSKRQMADPVIETSDQMPSWLNTCSCSMTSTIHTHWKTTYSTTLLGALFNHFWQKFLVRHAKGNYCLILLMIMLHNCLWAPCVPNSQPSSKEGD